MGPVVIADGDPNGPTLAIDFVIIGGGVAGLTAAVALRRVGQKVTVLERDSNFDINRTDLRGTRMPPNMTKIFNHWGMNSELREIGVVSSRIKLVRLENALMLGHHEWERELLEEARGEFTFVCHHDLRRLLLRTAQELGAIIRTSAEAVEVSRDGRSVRLVDGEEVVGDVIIGATGSLSLTREVLGGDAGAQGTAAGDPLVLFAGNVPAERIHADPLLAEWFEAQSVTQTVWLGDNYAASVFPFNREGDCCFYLYAPDDGSAPEQWEEVMHLEMVASYAANFEPRVQRLAQQLTSAFRVKIIERPVAENWVYDSGCFVGIGNAVHPFMPATIQSSSMGVEDASVLAKLFSHLITKSQIPDFLYAFEEIRQARCAKIQMVEDANTRYMSLPDGDAARGRDEHMRARYDAGKSAFGGDEDDDLTGSRWNENREVFGYDAEDAADNWWVEWGMLRLRAQDTDLSGLTAVAMTTTHE